MRIRCVRLAAALLGAGRASQQAFAQTAAPAAGQNVEWAGLGGNHSSQL
jgi:hypothetical protein